MDPVPLSVFDRAPIPFASTPGQALRNALELARRAEVFGYHRYWMAGHRLAQGVADAAPLALITLLAAATCRIRVGSGAVRTGHWTPPAIVEQFDAVDACYPGRIDLGLGRSDRWRAERGAEVPRPVPRPRQERVVDGLPIPRPFDPSLLADSPAVALFAKLLQQPRARPAAFTDQVDEIARLLAGTYRPAQGRAAQGRAAHVRPGEGADVELWILGGGPRSAQVAGERGLRFAVDPDAAPSNMLEAVEAYRNAFKPSAKLDKPYVLVSAEVAVGPDDAAAERLAAPHGLPDPRLVVDRVETQFVGSPATVAARLRELQRVTGADELLVTAITHDHTDRLRGLELLAAEWNGG